MESIHKINVEILISALTFYANKTKRNIAYQHKWLSDSQSLDFLSDSTPLVDDNGKKAGFKRRSILNPEYKCIGICSKMINDKFIKKFLGIDENCIKNEVNNKTEETKKENIINTIVLDSSKISYFKLSSFFNQIECLSLRDNFIRDISFLH